MGQRRVWHQLEADWGDLKYSVEVEVGQCLLVP